MKKLIAAAVFGLAGLAAFAGTCTITRISLVNTDGTHDTFGGQLDNSSGVNILQHNFLVSFLDSGNNVVETMTVAGCTRSIQDGTSGFFSATSSRPASETNVGLARIAFDSAFRVGDGRRGRHQPQRHHRHAHRRYAGRHGHDQEQRRRHARRCAGVHRRAG